MDAILETVTAIVVFAAGLVGRLGVVFAVMMVLLVPILAVVGAARGVQALVFRGRPTQLG